MEAPLRIWASPYDVEDGGPLDWSWPNVELGPCGLEGETEYIRAGLVPQWQPIETATELMRDTQWAIVKTTEGMEVGWWSAGQNCFLASPGAPLWGDAIKYFAVPPCD